MPWVLPALAAGAALLDWVTIARDDLRLELAKPLIARCRTVPSYNASTGHDLRLAELAMTSLNPLAAKTSGLPGASRDLAASDGCLERAFRKRLGAPLVGLR